MPRLPTPLRLTAEDFDELLARPAAGSAKSGRGRASRAKLELLPRMLRWARGTARRLEDQRIEARAVAVGFGAGTARGKASGGQRVLIQESPVSDAERAEEGARWVLELDAAGVHVGLEVPASSWGPLAQLRDAHGYEGWQAAVKESLEALPEPFTVGVGGDPAVPVSRLPPWGPLVERSVATRKPLHVGWHVPRDVAIAHSALLDEQLEDAVVLLGPVYKLLVRPQEGGGRGRAKGTLGRSPRSRPALARSRADLTPSPALARGARVRVLSGPFAGKVGVVKELDGKGWAEVMLGLLATRIDVKDLSASAGGGRPTLSSSHRKPLALR
jgi:hypothetical protein